MRKNSNRYVSLDWFEAHNAEQYVWTAGYTQASVELERYIAKMARESARNGPYTLTCKLGNGFLIQAVFADPRDLMTFKLKVDV